MGMGLGAHPQTTPAWLRAAVLLKQGQESGDHTQERVSMKYENHGLDKRGNLQSKLEFHQNQIFRKTKIAVFMDTQDVDAPKKGTSPHTLKLSSENGSLLDNKKARSIAESCIAWFNKNPEDLATFIRTVRRQETFSLRIIDWTTTNYSKRHRITIYHQGLPVDLHLDYRRNLGVWTKKMYDPFARRERLTLHLEPGNQTISTTVGQMNFMRWLLERKVHLKVAELKAEIEKDMRAYDGKEDHHYQEDRYLVYNGPFRLQF